MRLRLIYGANDMTGEELKKARLESEMTQAKLAEQIGYTERQVRAWEKGVVEIPSRTALILRRNLHV